MLRGGGIESSDSRSKITSLPRCTGSCARDMPKLMKWKNKSKLNSKRKVINRQSCQTRQARCDRMLLVRLNKHT
jgi:hypothetical protein